MRRVIGVLVTAGLVLGLGAAPRAGASSVPGTPSPQLVPYLDGVGVGLSQVVVRNTGGAATGPRAPIVLLISGNAQRVEGAGWSCSAQERTCTTMDPVAPGASSAPLVLRSETGSLRVQTLGSSGEIATEVQVADTEGALLLLGTTVPAAGPQYGRARLRTTGSGSGLDGPVTVWLAHDALSSDYAGSRVWATGNGWTCASPRPRGLPCTHAGPLAPGASLPDLYVTRVPSGVALSAELDGQPRGKASRLVLPVGPRVYSGLRVAGVERRPHGAITLRLSRPSWYAVDGAPSVTDTGGRYLDTTVACLPGPCSGGPVTEFVVRPRAGAPTVPGEVYFLTVSPPAVSSEERVQTRLFTTAQQDLLAPSWPRAQVVGALNGTDATESLAGAQVTASVTEGGRLWFTAGPDRGLARILVNGRPVAVLDQWAPTVRYRQSVRIAVPRQQRRTVTLVVLGRKRAASTGTTVSADAVSDCDLPDLPSSFCRPYDIGVAPGSSFAWSRAPGGRSDGVLARATSGAVLSTPLFGAGFDVHYAAGPAGGTFGALVNGRRVRTIDTRTSSVGSGIASLRGGLAGRQTVSLVVDSGVVGIDAVVAR